MGLFSSIKNNMKKAEAAVILQNLFEHMNMHESLDGGDPASIANKLIGAAWDKKPEVFDGSFGGDRPHKITIALYALANGIEALSPDSILRTYLVPPFVRLMSEVQQNGPLYSFNEVDHFIFEPCFAVYSRLEDEMGLSEGMNGI